MIEDEVNVAVVQATQTKIELLARSEEEEVLYITFLTLNLDSFCVNLMSDLIKMSWGFPFSSSPMSGYAVVKVKFQFKELLFNLF